MTRPSLDRLDAAAARRWFEQAAEALGRRRTEIDALNVFPVPDRDTGTNMLVTMRSASRAAADATGHPDLTGTAAAAAAGALDAACGSSGVILACYLRGLADGLSGHSEADGRALATALAHAADSAYAGVSDPLEGTVLSVARAAALAAGKDDSSLSTVATAAAAGAREELARTTAQLPALATANVVDAGGQGLVVVLDALADVATGATTPAAENVAVAPPDAMTAAATPLRFAYEVQYLLEAHADVLPELRRRLDHLGDSVAVVRGDDHHNVHAHVNDVGAAIEAALDLGRPSQIRVTHFGDQIAAGAE